MIEQLVVHERLLASVSVDERSEVLYHDGVHQLRVANHQQRLASLEDAEIPLAVELAVQRMDDVDERCAARDHVAEAAEWRCRHGLRYSELRPLTVVVCQVKVAQEHDQQNGGSVQLDERNRPHVRHGEFNRLAGCRRDIAGNARTNKQRPMCTSVRTAQDL